MNAAEKKRVEQLLTGKADSVLGIRRDRHGQWWYEDRKVEYPESAIKPPKNLMERLNKAYQGLSPSEARVARVDAAISDLKEAGFAVGYQQSHFEFTPPDVNPGASLVEEARTIRDERKERVSQAVETAIIQLWADDEFDVEGFVASIESA